MLASRRPDDQARCDIKGLLDFIQSGDGLNGIRIEDNNIAPGDEAQLMIRMLLPVLVDRIRPKSVNPRVPLNSRLLGTRNQRNYIKAKRVPP